MGAELPITKAPSANLVPQQVLAIVSWIFFSNLTIVFNKWLFDTNFKYPVILTCWHLFFATIATQIMARTTNLLDSRKTIGMTSEIYCRKVIPIAVLFSGSLVCGNLSYLHLTVAFIQMLKASAPAIALVVSLAWKLKEPSWGAFFNIAIISIGVILASIGELRWDLTGVILQMSSTVFEVLRLIMTEVLLKSENDELGKMDTLLTLYYYAPACVVVNTVVAFLTEGPLFRMDDIWATGIDVLIINAGVAFMLNISSVFLISKTSGLVLTLTGILKQVILVFASVLIWYTPIPPLQILGYGIALGGLIAYSQALKLKDLLNLWSWLKSILYTR